MTNDDGKFAFDIALSYAGEERVYAEELAAGLRDAGVRIFYDQDNTAALWGENLFEALDKVYRKESRYAVMFVSHSYAEKMWTRHERRSLQARALTEQSAYILPVRFDDTELEGLLPSIAYLDARHLGMQGVIDIVLEKLAIENPSSTESKEWSTGIPRTPEQMQAIITQRPPGWEYMYYSGALIQSRAALEEKYRDHVIGYAPSTGRICHNKIEVIDMIQEFLTRFTHLAELFGKVLDQKAQEAAFGELGEPADPERIMHIARRYIDVYGGFMDASAALRGASVPEQYAPWRDVIAEYPSQSIERMRDFVDELIPLLHDLPQRVQKGEHIEISMLVKLEIPEELTIESSRLLNDLD